jgi:hypothetical protein
MPPTLTPARFERPVMSQEFSFTETPHGAFGVLAILHFPGQPARRFTRREATIVARALKAVAQGTSAEHQVYMSPIASDHDFEARVAETGIVVISDGCVDVQFDWNDVGVLSRRFESFGSGG